MQWEKVGKWMGSVGPDWRTRDDRGRIHINATRRRVGRGGTRQYDVNYRVIYYPIGATAATVVLDYCGGFERAKQIAEAFIQGSKSTPLPTIAPAFAVSQET